jgi:phosphohistidine swiveling domain-containing protein
VKRLVLPLSDPQADVATVGGKGMSLARLARAGLPVPDGFHVTTEAYRRFLDANDLQSLILSALDEADAVRPTTLESASATIRRLFADAVIPLDIVADIRSAYDALAPAGSGPDFPVAVRSSATAEDLPDASFAGQQDTYLNIHGADAVVASVQKCWASLWTGRAIAYRLRQHVAPESVALAVVVQLLVPADAAGVLFTANPLTGKLTEAVINSSWGLGEAIVGGNVTPDTITVDAPTGRILERQTAEKRVMTVRTASGTEEQPVPEALAGRAVLSDSQAAELARLGSRIEQLYSMPMDIEWTLEGGRFAIVQARPITTLGEAPLEWKAPNPKGIYMRASIVDLMPDPLSPLFATLGIPALVEQMKPVGQAVMRSRPVLHSDYYTTINSYGYMNVAFPPRTWWWVLTSMIPSYPRLLRTGLSLWRDRVRPGYQQAVAQMRGSSLAEIPAGGLWQAAIKLVDAAMYYVATLLFVTMGPTTGAEALLNKLYTKYARHEGDPAGIALLMGWNSIPVRAEKSLYDLAAWISQDKALTEYLLRTPSSDLTAQLRSPAPAATPHLAELASRLDQHMGEFGHAVFQMDFAEDLPLDHPEPMIESIKMYLRGQGVNPYERQKASEERRIQTADMALKRLRGLRRWLFHKTLNWAQPLSEAREDALADIGLGYPLLRNMLLELGRRLADAGVIESAKDIFWLEKQEVEAYVAGDNRCLAGSVAERKAFAVKAKQSAPPPMLPFRKRFMGMKTSVWLADSDGNKTANTLKGIPTCPGRVTAPACVLHGPEDFGRMRPGDVLVAATTTPAWTPLFAMASAVVTDIGGPLSHGSIVAREYGIPAVMSTGVGTHRIHDGEIITVDGSAGTVTITDTGG